MQKGPQQGWQCVLSSVSCPRSLELGPTVGQGGTGQRGSTCAGQCDCRVGSSAAVPWWWRWPGGGDPTPDASMAPGANQPMDTHPLCPSILCSRSASAEVLLSFTALWWRHLVLSINHLI